MSEKVHKKVLVVGDQSCGKTCLLTQFIQRRFLNDNIPDALDNQKVNMEYQGQQVVLDIWDTHGQNYKREMNKYCYDTDVILMCFSIDNPDSLESISYHWGAEMKFCCPKVPTVLVGTKADLRESKKVICELAAQNKEPVKTEYALGKAKLVGALEYCECSAKWNEQIKSVFKAAVRATMNMRQKSCIIL